MVAQQYNCWSDAVLLGNLVDDLVLEQRATGATQGAVGGNVNALLLAEVDNLLLWQQRVILDLVGGGDNCGLRKQLL